MVQLVFISIEYECCCECDYVVLYKKMIFTFLYMIVSLYTMLMYGAVSSPFEQGIALYVNVLINYERFRSILVSILPFSNLCLCITVCHFILLFKQEQHLYSVCSICCCFGP